MADSGLDCAKICVATAQGACQHLEHVASILPQGSAAAAVATKLGATLTIGSLAVTPMGVAGAAIACWAAVTNDCAKLTALLKDVQTEADDARTALLDLLQAKEDHEKECTHFPFAEDVLKQLAQVVAEVYQICAEVRDLPRLAKWLERVVNNEARLRNALHDLKQSMKPVERQHHRLILSLSRRVSRIEATKVTSPLPPSYDASHVLPVYARRGGQANESDGDARPEDSDSSRVTRGVCNDEHEHAACSPPPPPVAASAQSPSPSQATSSYIHQAMQLLNGVPGVVEPNLERAMELLETAVNEVSVIWRTWLRRAPGWPVKHIQRHLF